jgi:hypothetical protein
MKMMKKAAFALLLMAGPGLALAQTDADMLTIITSDEEQTQAMALILTMQAQRADVSPQVLLCDDAGELAVASEASDSEVLRGPDASPAFLPNSEYTDTDLIDGVGVAQPPAIGAIVADPAVRLFTF